MLIMSNDIHTQSHYKGKQDSLYKFAEEIHHLDIYICRVGATL